MHSQTIKNVAEVTQYEYLGIRAHRGDRLDIGNPLPSSHVWDDGDMLDELLEGICALRILHDSWNETIDQNSVAKAIKDIDAYTWDNSPVVLIGGNYAMEGNDVGEIIIRDAVLLQYFEKPSSR